ncbi:MAG: helix-turn-helix domain-containing protein [Pseudomonadota bacterium]
MPDLAAPAAFEMVRRPPSQRNAGLISVMSGYREMARGRFSQREAAPLTVPLIISFGTPFTIALGREPDAADRQDNSYGSFAAGLYAGAVYIESDGGAECVQVDFTPLGAFRFFGGAVVDLAARMIDIDDVLGAEGTRLRERLGATSGWQRRFDIVEDFIVHRASHRPSPELEFAWRRLARSGGGIRIAALAEEIGWSRKHLVDRFRSEFGLAPKPLARMMRFHSACRLARTGTATGWAGIAADSGFADQAHLVREFVSLAGEPPTAWARRLALTDSRLTRPEQAVWGR